MLSDVVNVPRQWCSPAVSVSLVFILYIADIMLLNKIFIRVTRKKQCVVCGLYDDISYHLLTVKKWDLLG